MGAADELVVRVSPDFGAVSPAIAEVSDYLQTHSTVAAVVYRVEVVLEELLTNVIRHGFDQPTANGSLTIRARSLGSEEVTLVIEDNAPPFDPTAVPDPGVSTTLDAVGIGGLGLRMVRKMTSSLLHEHLPEGNRLRAKIRA